MSEWLKLQGLGYMPTVRYRCSSESFKLSTYLLDTIIRRSGFVDAVVGVGRFRVIGVHILLLLGMIS